MTTVKEKHQQVNPEEVVAAHRTVQAFVTAYKSFCVYPEDHVFCRSNLEKLGKQLETYFSTQEELPLTIQKSTFVYKGETLFEAPLDENNPAYLLTRDGIIQLFFLQGIERSELVELFRILTRHRSAGEESGGDIVTSLWQADFEHISYEEIDIFALEAFDFDLGSLQVSPDETTTQPLPATSQQKEQEQKTIAESSGLEDLSDEAQSIAQSETVTNLLNMEQSFNVLELTREERATLKWYVEEEERKDYTNDIIDVLLIILVSQKHELRFFQVLEFLAGVFFDTLNKGQFNLAYKLCGNVKVIGEQIKKIRPWAKELIKSFMRMLTNEEEWVSLPWMPAPREVITDEENLKCLLQIFRLLPSESMFAMGALISRIEMKNLHARNELFELIESKAKDSPETFGAMLSRGDENVNALLYPILGSLGRIDAANISLQMTSHKSTEVRLMGLEGYIIHSSEPDMEALYPLLNDENEVIVNKLLSFFLAKADKEAVEDLLLRYLEQALNTNVVNAHLFEYYKALSMCGSNRSVKVLEKILLESKVSEMFSNLSAVHKKGSALALKAIGSEEALNVLHKGKKSMRPDIRLASQFALEKMK